MAYMKQVSLQVEECQTTAGLINAALTDVEGSLNHGLTATQEAIALLPALKHQWRELGQLDLDIPTELWAEVKELREKLHQIETQIITLDQLVDLVEETLEPDQETTDGGSGVIEGEQPTDGVAVELSELTEAPSTSQLALRYLLDVLPFLLLLVVLGLSARLVVLCPCWFYR